MGWVITKASGNERVREQKKRKREQERHNGRGRQEESSEGFSSPSLR